MKKILLPVLALAFAVAAVSCQKNDYRYYKKGQDAIYFSYPDDQLEKMEISLARYFQDEVEVKIPLELAGYACDEVRHYEIRIVDENTTAIAGTHYIAPDQRQTFRAQSCFDTLRITLLTTDPELVNEERRLYIELVPTDDLAAGIEYRQHVDIRFTNGLVRPKDWIDGNWAMYYGVCFGTYSRVKHAHILRELELEEIPDDWDGDGGKWDYYGAKMNQYFTDNVITDDNGMRIQPWR